MTRLVPSIPPSQPTTLTDVHRPATESVRVWTAAGLELSLRRETQIIM